MVTVWPAGMVLLAGAEEREAVLEEAILALAALGRAVEDVALLAVLAVVTQDRPHRPALEAEQAAAELQREAVQPGGCAAP